MPAHEFIWIDLETTGLDPHKGLVLEFAAVLCEDARGDDFAIVAQYQGVIHHSRAAVDQLYIDNVIEHMHHTNGLWNESSASSITTEEADAFLYELAESLSPGKKRAITLAGSSVHFDRAWCAVHFPCFAEKLSHRVFDVTTLRRACDAWAPTNIEWPVRDTHRALPDILASISEARIARRAMFGGAS